MSGREYEMTVGIEVHVELDTKTKIFCSCSSSFGGEPNTRCCPVCMGLPGSLPALNAQAVEYAVMAGLATGCKISRRSAFDRKNYFYPDLPKAYQITQYDTPICKDGSVDIETEQGRKSIGITRIHIEEDAGKLIHGGDGMTLIDFNRCGVPLIEIVSAPDMSSSEEAKAYLKKLRALMLYIGISDCKMNEGSFRCDVNISVRRAGDSALGVKTELKNLNSFTFAKKAIDYEFERQTAIIEAGGRIEAQTRRFEESDGKTYLMRSKESENDYRYFPEPDLLPIELSENMIKRISENMPRLPDERKAEYISSYGISTYDAELLVSDKSVSDYFEACAALTPYRKTLANLILSELMRFVEGDGFASHISPSNLAELATLAGEEAINASVAKKLLRRLWESDESPLAIVERENLRQINDVVWLTNLTLKAIAENPKALSDYKAGKTVAAKSIIGKVMSKTGGLANPSLLSDIVLAELDK